MPGSEGKRELGGLARSIDALFSTPKPAPAPSEAEEAPDAPADALELLPEQGESEEESEALEEAAFLMEPEHLEKPEAPVDAEFLVETEVIEEAEVFSDIEALPTLEPLATEPPSPLAESETIDESDALASLAEFDVTSEFTRAPEPEVSAALEAELAEEPRASREEAAPGRTTPPDELGDAVEAFLAGSPGAADEVETVAAALRDRLSLDPLADAVDRLVDAAGEPPESGILELARSIMNPAVASRLVQRMGHEHDEERLARYTRMCRALGVIMANAFRGALTDSTDEHARRVYYDALIGMGEISRQVIEEMVEDENRFLVLNAVAILGEIGGPRAVELVTSALADTDPRVRREALLSLGKLGDADAGQLILGSIDDPDQSVRVAAAIAAGELGLERALRPVLGMLADEDDPDVCISLLRALGQIGDPGAVQAIEKHAVGGLFSKPRTDVRVAAYRALNEIGTPHARQLLEQARSDKDRGVQIVVRDILKED